MLVELVEEVKAGLVVGDRLGISVASFLTSDTWTGC